MKTPAKNRRPATKLDWTPTYRRWVDGERRARTAPIPVLTGDIRPYATQPKPRKRKAA